MPWSNNPDDYLKEMRSANSDGDYECTFCGWQTDIGGAFRNRERNWCEPDDEMRWFKQTDDE